MKLLLVNPPQSHTITGNLPRYVDESRGNIPPLGLLYLAAAVEKNAEGWQVEICDMPVGDKLDNYEPDLVGITATTFTMIDVLVVARKVKELWGSPVILGGIHPTIYPEETLNLPDVDYVFTGEGEVVFPLVLRGLLNKRHIIIRGTPPGMDTLPNPARHLVDKRKYYSTLGSNSYLTTMFTSRGCPYQCIFCHRETMGKRFRARSVQQVIAELRLISSMGISEVLIYDDTFTVDRGRVRDICGGIIDSKLDIKFDIRMRVDHADSITLKLLKDAGCKRIHYGVEASSNRILQSLRKGITIEQVKEAFKLTKGLGIETLAYFIIGSPGETQEDILQTIEFAKDLKPDYCHFAIMTPYPATPLYQMGLEQGLYGDYWRDFAKHPVSGWVAPYWVELPRELLLGMLYKAYRDFYWRPDRILREVIKTKSLKKLGKKGSSAIRMLAGRP